jgi:hypothetical protein
MGIIGKVYATSMLVLINSRMVFGSEDTPSTIVSAMRFATVPDTDKDIEAHNGDLVAVDSIEVQTAQSRSSEP